MRTRRDFLKLGAVVATTAMVAPVAILKALAAAPKVEVFLDDKGIFCELIPASTLTAAQLRLGRTLMALGKWGFLTPDAETEERLRKMLDLPPRQYSFDDLALWSAVHGYPAG